MKYWAEVKPNIYCIRIPFEDIFTSVYLVKTEKGAVVFDTATYDSDITDYVLPTLDALGITREVLKYVFISHGHRDHAGGLKKLLEYFPETFLVTKCASLKESYPDHNVWLPENGDVFLDVLKVVGIPGHTIDSSALLDMRTDTMICGDSLQLYGIFGSGKWGANIRFPNAHRVAVSALRQMKIQTVFTAHNYYPYGNVYEGKKEISAALDACLEPLAKIEQMIRNNPEMDDEQICECYNKPNNLPTLGCGVVTAVRKAMSENEVKCL